MGFDDSKKITLATKTHSSIMILLSMVSITLCIMEPVFLVALKAKLKNIYYAS